MKMILTYLKTKINTFNLNIDSKISGISENRLLLYAIILISFSAILVGNITGFFLEKSMVDQDLFGELGNHFADYNNFDGTLRRAPLYPFFLGIIIKLFGYNNFVFIFFQSFLLASLGVISFLISKNLFKSFKIAFVTGILVTIHPMCFIYVSKFLVELLFAPLVLIMIWFAYLSIIKPNFKNLALFGFFTGLSALCKSVTIIFPIFFAFFVLFFYLIKIELFKKIEKGTLVKLFIVPYIFMLLTILPWTIRNYTITNSFILVSKGVGYEFLRGKHIADENAFLLRETNEEIWAKFQIEYDNILRETKAFTSDKQNMVLDSIMKDYIIHNPGSYMIRSLKQIPTFWIRAENIKKSLFFVAMSVFTIFIFLLGFFKLKEKSIFSYTILITILYFNLLYASVLAIARYSMPIYPPMVIVGVFGIYTLYQNSKAKRNETNN